MKKLLKCFLLAASAITLFAGCSGLNGKDATVEAEGYAGICTLTISVDGVEPQRSVARTILPASLEDATNRPADMVYTLKGTSVTTGATLGTAGAGIVLNDSNASTRTGETGKYRVDIPYGAWEFTLEATSGSDLLLQGKCYRELKTSRLEVPFTLTTEGVPTAGAVTLSGSYTDAEGAAKSYKAGLYDLITGELKYPAEETKAATVAAKTFSFSATGVAPGRYSFQIRFYNDVVANQASAKQVGYWENIVVVAPGRTTTDDSINCGKINQSPASPAKLRAYRKAGSEDEDGYTVVLTWSDMSNNEENFVITIKDYSTNATGDVYKILGVTAPVDENDKHEVFFGSSMNAGGSLRASSKTASIKLPYGKIFDFEIQAENFVGLSDYDTDTDGIQAAPRNGAQLVSATDDTPAPGNNTDYPFYATTDKINRFAIDYFLNGGTLTLAGASEPYAGANKIEYASIYDYTTDTAKVLKTVLNGKLAIDNTATDANHLLKNGTKFVEWVKMDGTAIADTDLITYEGIAVKATYDDSTLISYDIVDTYYEITATATYGTDTDDVKNTEVDVTSNSSFTISAAVNGTVPATLTIDSIKVKITAPTGSTAASSATIKKSGNTNPSYTWNIADADSGVYTVSVEAKLTDGKKYEMTFYLELKR